MFRIPRAARFGPLLLAVAGCAGLPADRGYDGVARELAARGLATAPAAPTGDRAPRAPDGAVLAAPLTLVDAQRVALAHNPTLLAQFAALGIAQAEVFDATRLANPRFSIGWLDASGGGEQVTLGLAQNVADLLTLSPRRRIAEGELERARQQAAGALVALAAEVEAAYWRHVTARAVRDLRREIAGAAEVSADFADALFKAGNINEVERDRERAAAEEIALDAVRAEVDVAATRAALGALMGADAGQAFEVATALPLPVAAEDDAKALAGLAAAARLDLLAAQRRVTVLEDALGLARSYRWLGAFEAGVEHEREPDGSELSGPRFEFELPIFNQGQGRIVRAEAQLDAARAEAQALTLAIGAEVVRARAEVAAARTVVDRHREHILPLRERIAEGSRRLQNYMLIGQFEALADRRSVYAAYVGYLQALGDYWQARAGLARAIGAPLPSLDEAGSAVEPAALLAPATSATPSPHAHHAH